MAGTAAKIAAEGAGYGAVQGFGDGEGGIDQRLHSAEIAAGTGAVLAPVVAGAGALVGKGLAAGGRVLSESGFGAKAPVLDAAGKPIVGTDNQPVVCHPSGRPGCWPADRRYHDGPAGSTGGSSRTPPPVLPGDQPTTFQVTGDYGQGQKELELRNAKGASQAFIQRQADQNAVRVGAIAQAVPPEASSADLQSSLTAQQTTLAAQRDAATAQAGQGTLQTVGGASDNTPVQAGSTLRGAIDQTRAPALQAADAAVQTGQEQAAAGLDASGGVPSGDAATAQQQ